ncbi:MAG: hypothetical protein HDR07_10805 [Lachnospiraceae bacterium]|nr:hypothetical protein [Lachnospiraceae bacterium]
MENKQQKIKEAIIFNITIKEEYGGFALASNFITKVVNNKKLNALDVIGITSLLWKDCNEKNNFAKITKIIQSKNKFLAIRKPELLNDNIKNYKVIYCLWVDENALSDIVDLQYDCLLKRYFENEDIITVLFGSKSLFFKSSHYLYDLGWKHEDLYNTTYFIDSSEKEYKGQRLQINNVGGLTDFMPLYFFTKGDHDLFDLLSNIISPKELMEMYEKKNSNVSSFPAIQGCISLLRKQIAHSKKIDVNQVIDLLCSGNTFSFFLFCYSLAAIVENGLNDFGSLRKYYLKVQEYAAGCEQLVENAMHHSEAGCGTVTIRFHEASSMYLLKRYGDGLEKVPHLEILITDYAGINRSGNMADTFRSHLENDSKEIFKNLQPIDFLIERDDVQHKEEIQNAFAEFYKRSSHIGKHIGLRIFKHIIAENNGTFTFYSHRQHKLGQGENYKFHEYKTKNPNIDCMPGTGYTVLFPLKKSPYVITRAEVGIDDGIHLEKNISSFINEYQCASASIDADDIHYSRQDEKEKMIYALSRKLLTKRFTSNGKRRIIYISAKNLLEESAEYIAKALLMAGSLEYISDYVFYDCSKAFERNFQNTMKVYFAMQELNYLFQQKEFVIALYTDKPIESSFIIPGNSQKTLWVNRKNSYAGGGWDVVNWLPVGKNEYLSAETDYEDVPPYDILYAIDRNGKKETIFEQYILQVLNTDIQERMFGCKISGTHMRLGSTIHINNFYEAELLFSNRLFVSRFAYLLAKHMYMEKNLNRAECITFYSYALYSETLIVELINILERIYPNKDIDYAILEREAEHRDFKHTDRIRYSTAFKSEEEQRKHFQNRYIVCIVPVNSTLKTHEKLISLFCENNVGFSRERFIANYALVLVGSEEKNEYWEIEEHEKVLKNIELDIIPAPQYFILVKLKYFEALGCELCFPPNSLDEVPLVEVNAASTIPNQSFALYENADEKSHFTYKAIRQEEKELSVLKDSLIYRHIRRGENHYLYYFKTDEFFVSNKYSIILWLQQIQRKVVINQNDYHVLFCPAHFSNAGFLECVNRVIFQEAALIIRVDVDKEFRSNILAKYSNLTAFINLLVNNQSRAAIKVYYIDDSIITGRTFYRSKSLVSSIVEKYKQKEDNIDIHIFEKIFLLLDRNSKQSRLQYIECWDSKNKKEYQLDDNYFAYRTLHVSSMRSHGDSCTLCQLEREAELLYRTSATRQMSCYWKDQIEKFEIKSLKDKQDEQQAGKVQKIVPKEKAFRRMFCSHVLAMTMLSSIHGNRKENAITCFLKLLLEDYYERSKEISQAEAFEYLLSYLKIISRPFLVFDKTLKESAFDVQLLLAEGLLDNRKVKTIISHSSKPYLRESQALFRKLIEEIVRKDFSKEQKLDLFLLLMKQLTEMKSNYFIRNENVKKITAFAAEYDENAKGKLYNQYLHQTKKLLGVNSDTSKSAWFSHELCQKKDFLSLPEKILSNLILENTRAYFDGIEKICRNLQWGDDVMEFLCEERWYGAEFHYYSVFAEKMNSKKAPCDDDIRRFVERSFRMGKEDVPERDKDNLILLKPQESFREHLNKVADRYKKQRDMPFVKNLQKIVEKELQKAQYRDFRSILEDLEFMEKEINVDGMISMLAGAQLMSLCNTHKKESTKKGEIEVVCFRIVCLMEKILRARNVKIILECPLECEEWKDDIRKRYNSLLDEYGQDVKRLQMKLQEEKEYLEIADSGARPEIIDEVEIEVAGRLKDYRENRDAQTDGYFIDRENAYLIWEIGEAGSIRKDERKLLIYAQFYELDYPKDWQMLRNLFCMSYLLNNSVFGIEDMDYLVELILADKERLMYNMEKAHSHTAASIRAAQCEYVQMDEDAEGCFRSFVLTLLSDLQVSQVYRQSLKRGYYCRKLNVGFHTCGEALNVLYENMPLFIVNQKRIGDNDIYIKIYTTFPESGLIDEGESKLDEKDEILSYTFSNSYDEVFLLLLALIMNAAGPQRTGIEARGETDSEEGVINVYLTKSENGCLRIANKCGQEEIDVEHINEELCFPPRRNKGISLWSISRYVYGLLSILLCNEIELVKEEIHKTVDHDSVMAVLEQLRGTVSRTLREEFCVKVDVKKGKDGIKYFYMDIPILKGKYDEIFKIRKEDR